MYKFYFNNQRIVVKEKLTTEEQTKDALIIQFKNKKQIEDLSALCFKEELKYPIFFIHDDIEQLKNEILAHFEIIEAAGGLGVNPSDKVLIIKRNGLWDLPKGKVEQQDKDLIASAKREIEEETGLSNLEYLSAIELQNENKNRTFHTYKFKDNAVLKITHWYNFICKTEQKVNPQKEEGISEVIWVNKEKAKKLISESYLSLQDIMENHA